MLCLKFYLFSGFLGSGKTTIVTALTKHMVEQNHKKAMLIVNDVGDIGVDAKLMRKLDTDVYEIFGGCVCGQLGSLVPLLTELGDKYIVDVVLMEASGIAQPARFIDTIKRFLPVQAEIKVITIVDAERWFELHEVLTSLIESQIESAELVLVNKTDLVDEDKLSRVVKTVRKIKSEVDVLTVSANNSDDLLRVLEVI